MKFLSALLLAAPFALLAQAGDPLKSPGCAQALALLDAARGAAPEAGAPPALRARAAQACLGGGAPDGRSARVLQAPIVVPPPVITAPPAPQRLAAPRLPPPPVAIGRLPAPVHCDPGGCWADDGGRLRHLGPDLAGPHGLCGLQGALVYCP